MELLFYLAIVFVLIAVHETGHFLAGITSGIPASHMRIRLLSFPQHVAIKDGDGWLSPTNQEEITRYIELTRGYFTSKAAAFRWVAGGVLLECVFTVAVCLIAHGIGWTNLAFWTAAMSLGMPSKLIMMILRCSERFLKFSRVSSDGLEFFEYKPLKP